MFSVLLEQSSAAYDGYAAVVCSNIASAVKNIGSYVIVLFGVGLIIVAVMHIVRGLAMHGKEAWLMTFGTLLFGGFLAIDGLINLMGNFSRIGKDTLDYIAAGMEPTTANPITSGDPNATFGIDAAKHAIGVVSDNFFVPFARAAALTVGVLLIIMAIFQIGTYFRTAGKWKVSLTKVAVMATLGSVLFAATPAEPGAGWNWVVNKAVGATRDTIVGAAEGNYNSSVLFSAVGIIIGMQ